MQDKYVKILNFFFQKNCIIIYVIYNFICKNLGFCPKFEFNIYLVNGTESL